jgi:hypothetical protein
MHHFLQSNANKAKRKHAEVDEHMYEGDQQVEQLTQKPFRQKLNPLFSSPDGENN